MKRVSWCLVIMMAVILIPAIAQAAEAPTGTLKFQVSGCEIPGSRNYILIKDDQGFQVERLECGQDGLLESKQLEYGVYTLQFPSGMTAQRTLSADTKVVTVTFVDPAGANANGGNTGGSAPAASSGAPVVATGPVSDMFMVGFKPTIPRPATNGPGWQVVTIHSQFPNYEEGDQWYVFGSYSTEDQTVERWCDDQCQTGMVMTWRVPAGIDYVVANSNIPREALIPMGVGPGQSAVFFVRVRKPLDPKALLPPKPKASAEYGDVSEPQVEAVQSKDGLTWEYHFTFPRPPEATATAGARFGLDLVVGPYAYYTYSYSSFQTGGMGKIALTYGKIGVYGMGSIGAEFLRPGNDMIVRAHLYGAGLEYKFTNQWTAFGGWLHNAQSFLGDGKSLYTSNGGIAGVDFWPTKWLVLEGGIAYSKMKTADTSHGFDESKDEFRPYDEYGFLFMVGFDLAEIFK